jgi:hypothetical protein
VNRSLNHLELTDADRESIPKNAPLVEAVHPYFA